MEISHQETGSSKLTISKLVVFVILSLILIAANLLISYEFIVNYESLNLDIKEQLFYVFQSSLGVPLLFLISQLFIKWRSIKNTINCVFYGSLVALLGNVPTIWFILGSTVSNT